MVESIYKLVTDSYSLLPHYTKSLKCYSNPSGGRYEGETLKHDSLFFLFSFFNYRRKSFFNGGKLQKQWEKG